MATESQNLSFYIILCAYKAPYKALSSSFITSGIDSLSAKLT
jgi:hypothetical protein